MKIDLENGRRAKNAKMEGRLKIFMELMNMEVKQEDVMCPVKMVFKSNSSFHLVSSRDGSKSTCSCPRYNQCWDVTHVNTQR